MNRITLLRSVSAGALLLSVSVAAAQEALPAIDIGASRTPPRRTRAEPAATPPAPVSAPTVSRWSPTTADGKPAFVERFQLPNTVSSVTRRDIKDKINIVDTEDAVKYLPSLFVRKRNNGDTQAVLQTRTWGVNSSARSLVYADDLLLTALVGNDNSIGAPRWGLVAPEEIERVDFLYGPFSAQYPGNSMGGVLQITTRMPEKLEITAKQTVAVQDFSMWGTKEAFHTEVSAFTVGDKVGDFSWLVTGNYAHGTTQPLSYTTTNGNLFAYPGSFYGTTKNGLFAPVIGSGGNLENDQVNAKLKLAYDFSPTIRATYTLGFWSNDGTSIPQSFISPYGAAAFPSSPAVGNSVLQSFAGAYYRIQEKMLVNAAAVKSNSGGLFDWEASASHFTYLQSDQRSPWSVTPAPAAQLGFTAPGKDTRNDGTYWTLFDLKGIFRPDGPYGKHEISFGVHGDQFHLNNPVWLTTNWVAGLSAPQGVLLSAGNGTTRTQALWIQDAWQVRPDVKLTLGVRGEHWQASDGFNQAWPTGNVSATGLAFSNATLASKIQPLIQPELHHTRFSPKGSLQWQADKDWTVTGSIGLANRFPTAKELYNLQVVSSNNTVANPNPNLKPEVALSKELAFERKLSSDSSARVSFFDEEVRDAIISQSVYITGTAQSVNNPTNVDRIRNSGVEVAMRKDNAFIKGLELTGTATWLDARVISDPTWAPVRGTNYDDWAFRVEGKTVPNVPMWRWGVGATYRPDDNWSFSVNARYQGRMWTTLANNDIAHQVYQSFDRFFVVDTKIHYKYNERLSFDFGIDNIGNYKYFLFHPFPQRTYSFTANYEFGTDKKGAPGIFFTGNEAGLPTSWLQPGDYDWLTTN
jgi:iron complex outermembrane recepter protein